MNVDLLRREHEETQLIRLMDIFALGPFLIWSGMRRRGGLPAWARAAMVFSGVATIAFNGRNYLKQREEP